MVSNKKIWGRFKADERGNIAIMFGAAVTPMVMFVGGAIDFGQAYTIKGQIQRASDAAVLAAAAMSPDTSDADRMARAEQVFKSNTSKYPDIKTEISFGEISATIKASYKMPTSFLKIASIDILDVTTTASGSGKIDEPGRACILALDPNAEYGLKSQGTPNIDYTGCWAHTNSTSSTAIDGGGSATVVGEGHSAAGGVTNAAKSVYSPLPTPDAGTVADPYATVSAYETPYISYTPTFVPPTISGTCKASNLNLKKGTFTLSPGRYCGGIHMQAQAKVTFEAGIYIIDNGDFTTQSGSSITGSNVMFYFNGTGATATVIGGGTVNLKGRQSGSSYAGFLFIQNPSAARGETSNIQGGGTFNLEGVIYMPTQNILITGNGDSNASSKFFSMVAKSFEFRGNGIFRLKPHDPASNMPDIMPKVSPAVTALKLDS